MKWKKIEIDEIDVCILFENDDGDIVGIGRGITLPFIGSIFIAIIEGEKMVYRSEDACLEEVALW